MKRLNAFSLLILSLSFSAFAEIGNAHLGPTDILSVKSSDSVTCNADASIEDGYKSYLYVKVKKNVVISTTQGSFYITVTSNTIYDPEGKKGPKTPEEACSDKEGIKALNLVVIGTMRAFEDVKFRRPTCANTGFKVECVRLEVNIGYDGQEIIDTDWKPIPAPVTAKNLESYK